MCCLTLRERHGSNCDCTSCNERYGCQVTQEKRDIEEEGKNEVYRRQAARFRREAQAQQA